MKIITSVEYAKYNIEYAHLFDICQPSVEMVKANKDWVVRDGFSAFGTLLVGDLRVIKTSTDIMEIHPFSEWVGQCCVPGKRSGVVYAIIPIFSKNEMDQINQKPWHMRIEYLTNRIKTMTADELLAIRYEIGINIKIPANVPHDFIATIAPGEDIPYCQVFEPETTSIMDAFKFPPPFFPLNQEISIPK